ncbi:MAG TPA: RagB/SusD family nutrient uptake outer membrane protein [Cyclobacteriaceae bacterium]|jgi:tetratricopeptide (TPR) repeat protein|nr:RagB/SusD family nutrient uptake outer membrane protein [Cyclobacteriaceae bacterium]
MMRKIFKISICAFALVGLSGCYDKLNIADPNRLSSSQFYKTEDQAVAAVDAIYNTLIIDGLYQRMTPTMNDGRGDEISSRSPWGWFTGFSAFTIQPTDGANDIAWAGYFILVSRANQALENLPTVPDLDKDLLNRLMGQAYFLRGLAYFNMANIYEKVPLILAVPKGEEAFYPSNKDVTQDQIYDQVQADLDQAVALLPADYSSVTGPDKGTVGRATLGAALSLRGKLNLYRANYTAAAADFKQVIESNKYSLNTDYTKLFTGDASLELADPEKIFWAEFTDSNGSDYNWGGDPTVNWRQFIAVTPTYSRNDFFDFYPTSFLYNEMRAEKTIDGKLDPRYHATILSYEPAEGDSMAYGAKWADKGYLPTDYFIKKFTLAATGADPFRSGINYPVVRYADVLLMYAECQANTSNIPDAAKYVQIVRDRANLPDRESEFAAYSLDQFMTQLAHERIMELAIEGSRWNDIKRWGWLEDTNKLNELKSHDFEFNTFTSTRKYMPIPQTDLDRNPNLTGNAANNK